MCLVTDSRVFRIEQTAECEAPTIAASLATGVSLWRTAERKSSQRRNAYMESVMKKHLRRFAVSSAAVLAMVVMAQTLGSAQNNSPQVIVSFGLEGAMGAPNHVLIPNEVAITRGGKV